MTVEMVAHAVSRPPSLRQVTCKCRFSLRLFSSRTERHRQPPLLLCHLVPLACLLVFDCCHSFPSSSIFLHFFLPLRPPPTHNSRMTSTYNSVSSVASSSPGSGARYFLIENKATGQQYRVNNASFASGAFSSVHSKMHKGYVSLTSSSYAVHRPRKIHF